jgi:hypothetical protein
MDASHPPRFKIALAAKPALAPAAQEAAALRRFLSQVGGIENGRNALELLAMLSGSEPQDVRKAA